jgi:hypothetical protein
MLYMTLLSMFKSLATFTAEPTAMPKSMSLALKETS